MENIKLYFKSGISEQILTHEYETIIGSLYCLAFSRTTKKFVSGMLPGADHDLDLLKVWVIGCKTTHPRQKSTCK